MEHEVETAFALERTLARLSLKNLPSDGLNFLCRKEGTLSCSEGGSLNRGWDRVMVPAQRDLSAAWRPTGLCNHQLPVIPLRPTVRPSPGPHSTQATVWKSREQRCVLEKQRVRVCVSRSVLSESLQPPGW